MCSRVSNYAPTALDDASVYTALKEMSRKLQEISSNIFLDSTNLGNIDVYETELVSILLALEKIGQQKIQERNYNTLPQGVLVRLMQVYLKKAQMLSRKKDPAAKIYYTKAHEIGYALYNKSEFNFNLPKQCGIPEARLNNFVGIYSKSFRFSSDQCKDNPSFKGPCFTSNAFGYVVFVEGELTYNLAEAAMGMDRPDSISLAEEYLKKALGFQQIEKTGNFTPIDDREAHKTITIDGKIYYGFQARARVLEKVIAREKKVKEIEDLVHDKRYGEAIERASKFDFTAPFVDVGKLSKEFQATPEIKDHPETLKVQCFRVIAALAWAYYNQGKTLQSEEYLRKAYMLMLFLLGKVSSGNHDTLVVKSFFERENPFPGNNVGQVFAEGDRLANLFNFASKATISDERKEDFFRDTGREKNHLSDDAIFILVDIFSLIGAIKKDKTYKNKFVGFVKGALSDSPPAHLMFSKKGNTYLPSFIGKLIGYYGKEKDYATVALLYWHILGKDPLGDRATKLVTKNREWSKLAAENNSGLDFVRIGKFSGSEIFKKTRVNDQLNFAWAIYERGKKTPGLKRLAENLFAALLDTAYDYYIDKGKKLKVVEDRFVALKTLTQIYERLGFIYSREAATKEKGLQYLDFARRLYNLILDGKTDEYVGSDDKFKKLLAKATGEFNVTYEETAIGLDKGKYFKEMEISAKEVEMSLRSGLANVLNKLKKYEEAYKEFKVIYKFYKENPRLVKPDNFPMTIMGMVPYLIRKKQYADYKEAKALLMESIDLSSGSNLPAFLSGIQNLSWLYSSYASYLKPFLGRKEDSMRHIQIAAALIRALVHKKKTALQDPQMTAILDKIIEQRDQLMAEENLSELELVRTEISINLAGLFKANDKAEGAIGIYNWILSKSASDLDAEKLMAIRIGLAEAYARDAQLKMKAGETEEAEKQAREAEKYADLANLSASKFEDKFKAISAWAWARGIIAGKLKKEGKEIEAVKMFSETAAKYRSEIVEKLRGLTREDNDALTELKSSPQKILLAYAGMLKAARQYQSALIIYQRLEHIPEARIAIAEMYAEYGKVRMERQQEFSDIESAALKDQFVPAAERMAKALEKLSGQRIVKVKDGLVVLSAVRGLGWVLSELSRIGAESVSKDDLKKAAFMIYEALLGERNGLRIDETAMERFLNIEPGSFSRIMSFIRDHRGEIMHVEVLEEGEVSTWDIKTAYLNTIYNVSDSQKLLATVEKELAALKKESPEEQKRETAEKERFKANALLARANLYCWKMAKNNIKMSESYYKKAQADFEEALRIAEKILANCSGQDKNIENICFDSAFGIIHILIKQDKIAEAEEKLNEVIGKLSSARRNHFVRLGKAWAQMGDLRGEQEKWADAVQNYKKAMVYYDRFRSLKQERSQLYYSLANALYQVRDYKGAKDYYFNAIKAIRADGHSIDKLIADKEWAILSILIESELGLARVYKQDREYALSKARVKNAEDLLAKIPGDMDDKPKIARSAAKEFFDTERTVEEDSGEAAVSFSYNKGEYVDDKKKSSDTGFNKLNMRGSYPVSKDFRMGGGLSVGFGMPESSYTADKGNRVKYLTYTQSVGYDLWGKYKLERPSFNFEVTPFFRGENTSFNYYQNDENSGQVEKNGSYNANTLGAKLEFAPKWQVADGDVMLMPFVSAEGAVLLREGENEIDVRRQGMVDARDSLQRLNDKYPSGGPADERTKAIGEYNDKINALPDSTEPLGSGYGEIGLRVILPYVKLSDSWALSPTFYSATRGGYDETSSNGFFAVERSKAGRIAQAFGMDLKFRSRGPWQFFAGGLYQVGNYQYWEGSFGAGYKFNNGTVLKGKLGFSGYRGDNVSFDEIGGGIGLEF